MSFGRILKIQLIGSGNKNKNRVFQNLCLFKYSKNINDNATYFLNFRNTRDSDINEDENVSLQVQPHENEVQVDKKVPANIAIDIEENHESEYLRNLNKNYDINCHEMNDEIVKVSTKMNSNRAFKPLPPHKYVERFKSIEERSLTNSIHNLKQLSQSHNPSNKLDNVSVKDVDTQDHVKQDVIMMSNSSSDDNQHVVVLENHTNSINNRKLANSVVSVDEITSVPADIKPSPFSTELDDYIDLIGPPMIPSFNFAAYVNNSETLKELVNLGVDLYKIEQNIDQDLSQKVLQLNFETQIKPLIQFLNDIEVPANKLGMLISKNPHILLEEIDNLQIRVNYLKSKKFSAESIPQIIYRSPVWLSFTNKEIDRNLGILQKMFHLTGNELRKTVSEYPKVVTQSMRKISIMSFSVKEEMGFDDLEMKTIFTKKPRIWAQSKQSILNSFDYLHNEMKLSHEELVQYPYILCTRRFKLEQRHQFLKSVGRAQYDTSKPLYVSLQALISGTDGEFCINVAKKPVHVFNEFLKTL